MFASCASAAIFGSQRLLVFRDRVRVVDAHQQRAGDDILTLVHGNRPPVLVLHMSMHYHSPLATILGPVHDGNDH
jgi:hypothetical protein